VSKGERNCGMAGNRQSRRDARSSLWDNPDVTGTLAKNRISFAPRVTPGATSAGPLFFHDNPAQAAW
jgi:hypothetical protein